MTGSRSPSYVYQMLALVALVGCPSAAPATPASLSPGATSAETALRRAAAHDAAICSHYRIRHWLREKIVRESDLARYGLHLDDNWRNLPANTPVVILIHGFNSTPERNAALLKPIREARIPCGTFAYPNDYDIRASGELLACELRRFFRLYPDRRVVLLCHSMGGIVARTCVENAALDPGNVARLIMIAPPSHGSLIAHFAVGTDLWEHWLSRTSGGPWARFRDSVVDGLGEAADELCLDSDFLAELNSRGRNPRVRYTIFLGTGAMMSEEQLDWIRQSVCESLARLPGADGSAEKLDALLRDIDELVDGKGDGVVAVKRGRLDGVSDTLVLPFGHIAVTGDGRDEVLERVRCAVLERIE